MNAGQHVAVKMKKNLKKGVKASALTLECTMYKYEKETDSIYLNVSCPLTDISLDAIYECKVEEEKNQVKLTGRAIERYVSEDGSIVRIHIETGFYKNSIKSVDKTKAQC